MKKIKVFFEDVDYEQIKKLSDNEGVSMSEFIRNSVGMTFKKTPKKTAKDVARILFLLSNMSNNINQIAKKCNTKKMVDIHTLYSLSDIEYMIQEVLNDYKI
jgi:hypothetical protein